MSNSLRKSLLDFYDSRTGSLSEELKEVVRFVRERGVSIFPYDFPGEYQEKSIGVFKDPENGLRYVLQDGKRLYFKKRWSKKRIRHSYCELAKEQDHRSPHCYTNESFQFGAGEVLVDVGVAEGNFALSVVERASSLILFETDEEWISALRATFAPWTEKVQIVNLHVGKETNQAATRLDDFLPPGLTNIFLKVDVDGGEADLLLGSEKILQRPDPMKLAICTYHRQDDEKDFIRLLNHHGFRTSHSPGFMLFYYDKALSAPYFRRGILRGVKE